MSDDEDSEGNDNDKIYPLAGSAVINHRIISTHKYAKPSIAPSVASSAIGHVTYFDQMAAYDRSKKSKNIKETKCNRIYSYFNLVDFIMQCTLLGIICFEFLTIYGICVSKYKISETSDDVCQGDLDQCDQDTQCSYRPSICRCVPTPNNMYQLLSIIYIILCILRLLYALCGSFVICYSLRKGIKNKYLFVSGNVMHQTWMNTIADDCCIAICFSSTCCCNNIARVAYLTSIDQSKTFPTKRSFVVHNIFKILNIAFCGVYLYVYDTSTASFYVVAIIGIVFIFTLIMTVYRIRSKKKAQLQRVINTSPSLSATARSRDTNLT